MANKAAYLHNRDLFKEDDDVSSYQCKRHRGWHIGHPSKYDNPILHQAAVGARTFTGVSAGINTSTSVFYECTGTTSATNGHMCFGRNAHLQVDAEL